MIGKLMEPVAGKRHCQQNAGFTALRVVCNTVIIEKEEIHKAAIHRRMS